MVKQINIQAVFVNKNLLKKQKQLVIFSITPKKSIKKIIKIFK